MEQKLERLQFLARRSRIILWVFISLWIIGFIGLPLIIGLDIELLPHNYLLYQVFEWGEPLYLYHEELDTEIEVYLSEHLSYTAHNLLYLQSILRLFLIGAIVWKVDRLFYYFSRGRVFETVSVNILRQMGYLLLLLFVVAGLSETLLIWLIDSIEAGFISNSSEAQNFYTVFTLSIDISLLFSGLFLVLLSKILLISVEMKDEVDTLV